MTDVRVDRLAATRPFLGIGDDGWAIFAPGPGDRDLGDPDVWARARERSVRRREAAEARRVRLPQSAAARLSAALVAATVLAPTAEAAAAGSSATGASTGVGGLRFGAQGAAVRAVQRALGVAVDGVFGHGTSRAVKAWQRAHGLVVDGVVGPATRASLGLGSASASVRDAGGGAGASGGSAGGGAAQQLPAATARAVQDKLGVPADGVFGPVSRASLRRWQRAHGLVADGVVGPATLAAMGLAGASLERGDSTATASAPASASGSGTGVRAAVAAARTKLGDPYASGAEGPDAFDCSGLTQWAMRQAGVAIPRTSFSQYASGVAVSDVQAGDLVFFSTDGPGASHVGIATSASTAISATSHGVMEHTFRSGYWGAAYLGARRVS